MREDLQGLSRLAIAVAVLIFLPTSAMATVLATVVNPANGHTYHLLDAATWSASEAEAIMLAGHLVTIEDAAENVWVESTFKPFGNKFWLGYTDVISEDEFVWIDGSPVTFVNWGGIEPNDACPFGPEDVAIMYTNGEGLAGPNPISDGEWADIPDNVACGGGSPVRGVVKSTAANATIHVDFSNPVINSGPVSFGLPALPANPTATIAVSPGTPVGGGITSYGLGDVLSANLVFGDGTFVNLVAFDMQVLSNGTISSLSYTFAPLDTPSVTAGGIVMNSPLFISGTDIASGIPFSYTYANSIEIFTPSTPPAVPGLSTLGVACLSLFVFSLGGWMLTRRSGAFSRA